MTVGYGVWAWWGFKVWVSPLTRIVTLTTCCEHFQILGHLKFSLYVRHIGFQNGRHLKSTFAIISGHNAAIDLILVSICMFLGARNPMVPFSTWYCKVFAAIFYFKMAATWNLHLHLSLDIMQLLTWFWYLNVRFWGKESNGTNYHLVLSSICRHIGFQNGCFTLHGRFTIYIWHYLKYNVKCRLRSGHVMDLMYVCNVWSNVCDLM